MADESATTGLSIGEKLKALRTSKGESIDDLAQKVRLDSVVISQIERGATIPPVGTLIKIATALDINVSQFFEDDSAKPKKVEVVRSQERRRIQRQFVNKKSPLSYSYQSLAYRKSDKKMEPFLIELDIDVEEEIPALKHEGEEFLFVLEGEIEARMGDESIHLQKGDALYFESDVPHSFIGHGHKKPKAIVVLYTGDKREVTQK